MGLEEKEPNGFGLLRSVMNNDPLRRQIEPARPQPVKPVLRRVNLGETSFAKQFSDNLSDHPLSGLLKQYSPEEIERVLNQLSPAEVKSGTLQGFPIDLVRDELARLRLQATKDERERPMRVERQRARVANFKNLLLQERAARGEVRGSADDRKKIREMQGKMGLIFAAAGEDKMPPSRVDGKMVSLHRQLPPSLKGRLHAIAHETPEESALRRLDTTLEDFTRLAEARTAIDRYRGRALGSGVPLSTKAVVTSEGVQVFSSGQTRGQKDGRQRPDFEASWDDVATGRVTVSVAPTSVDPVRNLVKLIRGKPDNLPVSLIFKEMGSERLFKVTVPGGDELASVIRRHSRTLARNGDIEIAVNELKKEDPGALQKVLDDLDI